VRKNASNNKRAIDIFDGDVRDVDNGNSYSKVMPGGMVMIKLVNKCTADQCPLNQQGLCQDENKRWQRQWALSSD